MLCCKQREGYAAFVVVVCFLFLFDWFSVCVVWILWKLLQPCPVAYLLFDLSFVTVEFKIEIENMMILA